MRFVKDVRSCGKWFSVQAFVILATLPAVWVQLPQDAKAFLPVGWEPWVLVGLALAGLVGRVVDQGGDA